MGCTVAQIAEQLDAISEGSGANPGWPSQVFHHYLILPIFRFFDFLVKWVMVDGTHNQASY